jgi:transcriptional regulator with XRE-family HTH domain
MILMTTLGSRIKEERISHKLTQTELGKICGVTKYTISLSENDKSTPSDDIKKILADYFDVSVDYLLGITNTKKI